MTTDDRPRTPHALHEWIATHLGVRLCRTPLLGGHDAPFDYILHTFFEGEVARPTEPDAGARADGSVPAMHLNGHAPCSRRHPPDVVLWANRGGGKTFLGALATALDLVFKPGIQVRVLAGSLEQASRTLDHLRRFFEMPVLAEHVAGRMTQRRLALTSGSAVEILAASEASIRGTRVQKLRCDEVDLFDPELWDAAQLTTRSAVCGGVHVRGAVECLSTMHRPHGLMFRVVKDCAAGTRRLLKWGVVDALEVCPPARPCRSGAGDCPLVGECDGRAKRGLGAAEADASGEGVEGGHIAIDDAITMKSRVSLAVWEAEMLCLRPSRGHAVLAEFDPRVHVVRDTPRRGVRWYAGMDFGFRAPTVILWGALDESGVLWIVDEHVQAQMLLEDHIRALKEAPSARGVGEVEYVAADPAGNQRHEQTGSSNIEALRREGVHVVSRGVPIGEGLNLVRTRLRPAVGGVRLLIHERCTRLIESLERYHYPEDNPESMTPVKDGHDHAVDALRYLVSSLDKKHTTRKSGYTNGG